MKAFKPINLGKAIDNGEDSAKLWEAFCETDRVGSITACYKEEE